MLTRTGEPGFADGSAGVSKDACSTGLRFAPLPSRGVGFASYVEISARQPGFNSEYGLVEVLPNGRARIVAGTCLDQ